MQSNYFTTNDGIRLHYLEAGRGGPVIFLPGCWQSAEEYGFQVDALSQAHRVFALDYRGHGLSEKPDHGYRIARFSKDLSDFIDFLGISKLALVGHSMGNAVAWSYIDLFGAGKIEKLVIVDEPAFLVSNPAWSETELIELGRAI